jgi:5-formyltetrahydrofolate cyclo-ligase
MSKKSDLRRSLIAARHAISSDMRTRWDAAIGARMLAWLADNPVRTLGIYWPIQNEPDLRGVYADLAGQGIRLALPIVVRRDAPLEFACWTPGDTLMKDAYGVLIPAERSIAMQPDALLIPCVGFNMQGFRLGYGAGFYDRTLAATPRPVAIGIAYSCGLAAFDPAPHDIALDVILTEVSSGTEN